MSLRCLEERRFHNNDRCNAPANRHRRESEAKATQDQLRLFLLDQGLLSLRDPADIYF